MNLEPPQPPTAPAPAIRPTPPTPPRIVKDKWQGARDKSSDDVYEEMAKDAVANGSGALTKRTVDRGDKETQAAPAQVKDTQSDYDRGQDVLREFREMDARESQSARNYSYETEQPRTFTPKINPHEGHGGVFWIFTIIFVAVATFFIVKKFLFTDKPELTKSQLFDDDKKPPPKPVTTPARLPSKKDDDKKHFEVRV